MRHFCGKFIGALGLLCVSAGFAAADAKVEQLPLGPDGDSYGCSISPHGEHVAVLAAKGSRFVVVLDNVEGPKIEALFSNIYSNPWGVATYWAGKVPILFSDDGAHCAYIGKVGDEYIVVEDGKELARGPITPNASATSLEMTFSKGGQHLFYAHRDGERYRVIVDGKPGPASNLLSSPVMSPDGAHYAYVGYEDNTGVPAWAVVDGRQIKPIGDSFQYTGRDVLISRINDNGATGLLLNGKPTIKATSINPTWMSADGKEIAMVIMGKSGDPTILTVNGKVIPEAQGLIVQNVFFSLDGKRWAAVCQTKTGSNFMIIDGKKGEEYQTIMHDSGTNDFRQNWTWIQGKDPGSTPIGMPVPGFTADSSKFVYVAMQGSRKFMVTDEDESNPFNGNSELFPILSQTGNRIGVIGVATNGKQHVIIDGKETEYGPPSMPGVQSRCYGLTFTPDGKRYAFVNGPSLFVDGAAMPGTGVGNNYVFSPDDQHIAYMAGDSVGTRLFLDGKVVDTTLTSGATNHVFFSADSQHLFWMKNINLQSLGTKDQVQLILDGKPVTHMEDNAQSMSSNFNFEFGNDGVLSFVARTEEKLRLFHITPDSSQNITTLLAASKAPGAK